MDASAGRCRSRTDENARVWRRVRIDARDGTCENLRGVRHAARDDASDVVWIVTFQIRGSGLMPFENEVLKSWSETLDLIFNGLRLVDRRAMRHMAICVAGVFALRRTSRIELTLLTKN